MFAGTAQECDPGHIWPSSSLTLSEATGTRKHSHTQHEAELQPEMHHDAVPAPTTICMFRHKNKFP
jgi:hypothetical protein